MVAGAWGLAACVISYRLYCSSLHQHGCPVRSAAAADQFNFLPRRLAYHVVLQARKSRRLNKGGGSAR